MNLPAPSRSRRAFTLIEIMLALMIFSMLMGSVYATWALIIRSNQVGQAAANQAQRQRVVLRTIGDALMGIESFQASQKFYWFDYQNGTTPYLSFAAHLPMSFPHSRKSYGDMPGLDFSSRRVTFSLADGENGEKNLVLRQAPILMEMDADEKQYPCILARNVKTFIIESWATNKLNHAEWDKEWDETKTNTIPQMLRVTLVLGNKAGDSQSAPGFAATRIYTVPSEMMPAAVQRGGGPGIPGAPGGGLGGDPRLPPINPPGGHP
jgi:prepilin-type N-terminal cleavage/methylation domain-containing protein